MKFKNRQIFVETKDYESLVRWVLTAYGLNGYGNKLPSSLKINIPPERSTILLIEKKIH